jgi:hypothetical protein
MGKRKLVLDFRERVLIDNSIKSYIRNWEKTKHSLSDDIGKKNCDEQIEILKALREKIRFLDNDFDFDE